MAHVATPAECLPIWTAALSSIRAVWPDQVAETPQLSGYRLFVSDLADGFLAVHDAPIPRGPQAGTPASQLVLWVTLPSLNNARYRNVLQELFNFWFNEHHGGWCWGEVPSTISTRSFGFLDAPGRGFDHYTDTWPNRPDVVRHLYCYQVP